MSNNYFLPGTNIVNNDITNILNSNVSNIPTADITDVSIPNLYDINGTLFPRDIGLIVSEFPDEDADPNILTGEFCFIASGHYDITQTFQTLKSASHLPVRNQPAFLSDLSNNGFSIEFKNLPKITKFIPYNITAPAFLADENKGYSIDTTFNTLPNVVQMALITGKSTVPIISPAFLADENKGFHTKFKYYPAISFYDILHAESYKNFYAFIGTGSYSTEFSIDISDKIIETTDIQYDYTNTLQIYMNTYKLNNKIGVIKTADNTLIRSSYDTNSNTFDTDIINITSREVLYDISSNHIYKLGSFDNFYTNFIEYINNFFGIGGLTNQLFSSTNKPPIDISNNNIISYNKAYLSTILSTLTGNIKITDVASMINYCVIANPFKNRYSNIKNKDGFLEGDKFFVKDGITVTFNLDILNNIYHNDTSFNNLIDTSGNQSVPQPIYNYDLCYNNPFNISKTITTDLLIILKDNI